MNRRSESRVNWNGSVKYRAGHMSTYKMGLLMNMSTQSALLWLKEDFSIGSNLAVLMPPHDNPEHVHLIVVRTEETNREGYTGYGCRIGMRISEAI